MVERTEFLIKRINGTQYMALAEDLNLTPSAVKAGTIQCEHSIFNLPECQALNSDSVVLDVGAYIGDTACWFLDRGCFVHAFEPYPDAFMCLKYNCNHPRAWCYNAAVGNGSPVALDYVTYAGNLGTRGVKWADGINKSLRIDELGLQRVDLMKIDVEGFEASVIEGSQETIRRCKPVLVVECYPERLVGCGFSPNSITEWFDKLGMQHRIGVGQADHTRFDYVARFQPSSSPA